MNSTSSPPSSLDHRFWNESYLEADVLVAGGGAAGVSAAVTAARTGKKVILIERYGFCGGGAVAGLSGTICGLYLASESISVASKPQQLVFGFAEEFKNRLYQKGGLGEPVLYGNTWTHVHDPLVWKEVADGLITESKVQVIYHALIIGVIREGDEIQGLRVQTSGGVITVRSKITIDASGDATVFAQTGLETFIGDQGRIQNPTMIFRMTGVDLDLFWSTYGPNSIMSHEISDIISQLDEKKEYSLPRTKIFLFPSTPRRRGEVLCNCTRILGEDGRELNVLKYQDFTEAEIQGRSQVQEYARFFKKYLRGFEFAEVNDTGVQVGVRQTRQIMGMTLLGNADILKARKDSDSIARSAWPIELHTGKKPHVEWLFNDYYDIPYGCFVPKKGNSVLAAGRCLSAEHEAVASARVTAQCFAYGHAIGHAAAISIENKVQPRDIPTSIIRERLQKENARLD